MFFEQSLLFFPFWKSLHLGSMFIPMKWKYIFFFPLSPSTFKFSPFLPIHFQYFPQEEKIQGEPTLKDPGKSCMRHKGKGFFFQRWLRVIFEEKTLNHVGSHVDIKTCSKMAIDEVFTLINPMENHFCAPLVSKNMLSQWWCETGFNELFPFYTQIQSMCVLWRVCTTCPFQLSRENIIE